MFTSAILFLISLAVFTIVSIILIEYIYNKQLQAKKDKELQKTTPEKPVELELKVEPEEVIEEKLEEVEEVAPEIELEAEPEVIEEVQPEAVEEVVEEAKELPACEYPPFTHVRLVEMGLSDDEATEFVNELIPQIEEQIPLIEEAINSADFHQVERVTHGIKGSATNIGTGGVSDLLVEFNTYLKSGTDPDIVKAYQKHLIHYTQELKKQYS